MLKRLKAVFILLISLLSIALFSYQFDHTLKEECSYFENYSFTLTPFRLSKPSFDLLEQYSFVDSTQMVGIFNYGENELLLIREIAENGEIIRIYNKGLKQFYTFEFDKKIGFSFNEHNLIRFNPTRNENSKHEIVLKLYSYSHDKLQLSRTDIRTNTITIDGTQYFIAFTTNDFAFKIGEEFCSFYIDKNHNGKFDLNNDLDDNNNNINEKYNIDDSFILNGKPYQVSSISSDGFHVEISETKHEAKIATGFIMPNFDYKSGNQIKSFSNKSNETTFIFWWDPSCPGSVSGVPAVNKIWSKYKDYEHFNFISLTYLNGEIFNNSSNDITLPAGESIKAIFPTETDNHLLSSLLGETVPIVIIVDKEGVIKLKTSCSSLLGKYDEEKDENLIIYEKFISGLLDN
mgnify:CR=1 FL=1